MMTLDKVPLSLQVDLLKSVQATAKAMAHSTEPNPSDLKNWTAAFQTYNEALDKGNLESKRFGPAQFEKSFQEAVNAVNLFKQNAQAEASARNVDHTLVALVGALSKVMNSFIGKVRNLNEIKIEKKGKRVEKINKGKDADNKDKNKGEGD